jgi:ParB family chromosome partitioning protein
MATPPKTRLGRGLGAIISGGAAAGASAPSPARQKDNDKAKSSSSPAVPAGASASTPHAVPASAVSSLGFHEIPVAKVDANPYQPRRDFHPEQIQELADSIQAEGLLQPIVVRVAGERYQLIAGERRWRAFQLLKQKTIPARVVQAGDSSAATMALIENLQREGLNPIEEARGYSSLLHDFDLTQEQVSERVGKARATIANSLRLLGLDDEIQGYLGTGMLSTGHAKALLGLESKQEQLLLCRRVIADGLSVRATEALVGHVRHAGSNAAGGSSTGRAAPAAEAAALADIEKRLSSYLNARVHLKHARRKGRIVIEYAGNEDLQRILEKVGVED